MYWDYNAQMAVFMRQDNLIKMSFFQVTAQLSAPSLWSVEQNSSRYLLQWHFSLALSCLPPSAILFPARCAWIFKIDLFEVEQYKAKVKDFNEKMFRLVPTAFISHTGSTRSGYWSSFSVCVSSLICLCVVCHLSVCSH